VVAPIAKNSLLFANEMKGYIFPLLILPLLGLDSVRAGDRVYSVLELRKWESAEKPLIDKHPSSKRVYEMFDIKHDVALKIFSDAENSRVFVIFWGLDTKITCEKDGKRIPWADVLVPYLAEGWQTIGHVHADGSITETDSKTEKTKYWIGWWIERPKMGNLKILLKTRTSSFSFFWNANDKLPEITFLGVQRVQTQEKKDPPKSQP